MANPHNGEVSFSAGDETYTIRFSIDALCALEEQTGKGIVAISSELSDVSKLSLTLVRQVIWAGLREHHPKIDVKTAGELIGRAGGIPVAVDLIGKAMTLAFPEGKDTGRPRKPGPSGTGPASTKAGAD